MRIAFCVRAIFPQHGYGGLERAATGLVRHLLMQGVDIALYTQALSPGEPFEVPASAPGRLSIHTAQYGRLPLRPNGIPARLTNYRVFVERLGQQAVRAGQTGLVDGIYATGLFVWGAREAGRWGLPLVANPQGMEEFKLKDLPKRLAYAPFRAWVRAGCRGADRVLATDRSLFHEVVSLLKVEPRRVEVIPNGIDIDEVRKYSSAEAQAALADRFPGFASARTLRGISVGRLEANKGFENLLRALSKASAGLGADWSWIIVGSGSLREALEKMAREGGLEEHVTFPGSVGENDLHNLYETADLFVHPTLFEGSSLVTLEAMAHRLPVVASAVGGIPDKVVPGETGFLLPPDSVDALAERILWMAQHPDERKVMGIRGALVAEQKFSWREIAVSTRALFERLGSEKASCQGEEAPAPSC